MKRALVFDSGVGGLSVLDAILAAGHEIEIDYVADNAWLPYGLKSDAEIAARAPALLSRLAAQWRPDVAVLACNTASTIALEPVRSALDIPVVGVVPPIKPAAAASKTGVIGLLATPATVRRAYTTQLIGDFAADKRVIRFGSAELVAAAEQKLRGETPDPRALAAAIDGLFGAPGGADIDVVALACTHFPLLAEELAVAAPRACQWLDSGAAIARRLAHLLILPPGAARTRQAGFTAPDMIVSALPAFRARGFSAFTAIGAAPRFSAEPLAA